MSTLDSSVNRRWQKWIEFFGSKISSVLTISEKFNSILTKSNLFSLLGPVRGETVTVGTYILMGI